MQGYELFDSGLPSESLDCGLIETTEVTDVPAVSVVIPTLNGLPYIGMQLKALAEQETDFPWEVVVADNGSTDGTQEFVASEISAFPVALRVVDASQQRGAAHARNVGVDAARAERCAFCDCDDVVMPGWLTNAYRALGDADFATGPLRLFRRQPGDSRVVWGKSTLEGVSGLELAGCNFSCKRSKYQELGGTDESFYRWGGEDSEFSLRVSLSGSSAVFEPDMQIFYRHPSEIVRMIVKWYAGGRNDIAIWRMYPQLFAHRLGRIATLREIVGIPNRALGRRSLQFGIQLFFKGLGQLREQLREPEASLHNGQRIRSGMILRVSSQAWCATEHPVFSKTPDATAAHLYSYLCSDNPHCVQVGSLPVLAGNFGPDWGFIRSARTLRMAVRAFRPIFVESLDDYADNVLFVTPLTYSSARPIKRYSGISRPAPTKKGALALRLGHAVWDALIGWHRRHAFVPANTAERASRRNQPGAEG